MSDPEAYERAVREMRAVNAVWERASRAEVARIEAEAVSKYTGFGAAPEVTEQLVPLTAGRGYTEGYIDALGLQTEVLAEMYLICRRLGAKSDLLAMLGSWSEGDVEPHDGLAYLRAYNGAEREAA